MDPDTDIRTTFLQVIDERKDGEPQMSSVLQEVARRLNLRNSDIATQRAALTFFYDMFRIGYLAWGYNITNPSPPFFHITELGRRALETYSRDPSNPGGYLSYVRSCGTLGDIADAYIVEGVSCYNALCYRAAAVMVGAAAETIAVDLKEAVKTRLTELGKKVNPDYDSRTTAKMMEALTTVFMQHKSILPAPLDESFEPNWPAFVAQIRISRNDAGHPKRLDSAALGTVHGSLLIFPELVKMNDQLRQWVATAPLYKTGAA